MLVLLVSLVHRLSPPRLARLLLHAGTMDGHHVVLQLAGSGEGEGALTTEGRVYTTGVSNFAAVLVAVRQGLVLSQGLDARELVVTQAAGVLDADPRVVPVHHVHVVM